VHAKKNNVTQIPGAYFQHNHLPDLLVRFFD